jgi:hypothetical protein
VAQDLGAFWQEVEAQGWDAALKDRGLTPGPPGTAAMLAAGVSEGLAGSGGGLEEAVVRTSLAVVLRPAVQAEPRPEAAQVVRRFLAAAFSLRLTLDLGEPLEAAAGGYGRLRDGLNRIMALVEATAPGPGEAPDTPATPEHWRGLPGWTWVTALMAGLRHNRG